MCIIIFILFHKFLFILELIFFLQGREWDTIQTVAASLLAFCIIFTLGAILFEHFWFYRPMMIELQKAFDTQRNNY